MSLTRKSEGWGVIKPKSDLSSVNFVGPSSSRSTAGKGATRGSNGGVTREEEEEKKEVEVEGMAEVNFKPPWGRSTAEREARAKDG